MKYKIIILDIKYSSEKEKDQLIKFIKYNHYNNHIEYLYNDNYILFIKYDDNVDVYTTDINNINYLIGLNIYDIFTISGINEFFRYIKISKLKNNINII